ncbi:MAG: adenylosuccinate synthase [Bacteroidales bacterium]|jgi:adenylosuccinate synthase|nr:adenylosuccinate synthase [Bacteroidales bacterium]
MKIDVLLGLQWGDEGKGKIVDVLTPKYDIIARFQGGPNAGHTLEFNEIKHVLHTIPSGIFRENSINIIGNGVVIDPVILLEEIIKAEKIGAKIKSNLLISKKATLIMPTHRLLDHAYEKAKGNDKIGTTNKGIGPAYTDKIARMSLKIGDIFKNNFKEKYNIAKEYHLKLLKTFDYLEIEENYEKKWFEAIKLLEGYQCIDSEIFINNSILENKKILAEGAQGTMLDIDFGTYPFVTSSNTITCGVCSGLGVAPQKIGEVFGICKAYCTRVGSGPFPTKLTNETGKKMQDQGHEFGSTTGRPRDCGWLDLVALKYAIMIDGVTQLILTKVDVLNNFDIIKVGIAYKVNNEILDHFPYELNDDVEVVYKEFKGWNCELENCKSFVDLPIELKKYLQFIESETKVMVKYLSVGADRKQTIELNRNGKLTDEE